MSRTVLVYYVDDEEHLCDLFREYLELVGFEVETFVDASTAISACREHPPSIIFIDFRLADTTGDLVARAIDPHIPKILVTGDLGKKALAPFVAILQKPFKLPELLGQIEEHVGSI